MRAKVKIQPVRMAPTQIGIGKARMADEAWTHGPPKPRDVVRSKEVPPEPVDLETLAREDDWPNVLPLQRMGSIDDVDKLPRDVSAYVVGDLGLNFGLLGQVCQLGKPILTHWDAFGYSRQARLVRGFVELETGNKVTVMGMDRKATRLWCSGGEVVWTEDTVDGMEQGC